MASDVMLICKSKSEMASDVKLMQNYVKLITNYELRITEKNT